MSSIWPSTYPNFKRIPLFCISTDCGAGCDCTRIFNSFGFLVFALVLVANRNRERKIEMRRSVKNVIQHNQAVSINIEERRNNKTTINLTISSPISGVMLMLLLLILRVSEVEAPSDL